MGNFTIKGFTPRKGILGAALIGLLLATACGGTEPTATTTVTQPTATIATVQSTATTATVMATATTAMDMSTMTADETPTMAMDMGTMTSEATATTASGAEAMPTATTAASGATQGAAIQATLREWALDLSTTEATAGTITFQVTNNGKFPHNFAIRDASGKQLEKTANFTTSSGVQTVTIDLAAGTYTLYCALPGHEQQGQVNTLVVK